MLILSAQQQCNWKPYVSRKCQALLLSSQYGLHAILLLLLKCKWILIFKHTYIHACILFQSFCNSQCFHRRALNPRFISSMLCFSMLMSDPEVTGYRLDNARRTAFANSMSVSLSPLCCVLLAEQAGRQPYTHAHYCQFQRFQRCILGIASERGIWIKVEPK